MSATKNYRGRHARPAQYRGIKRAVIIVLIVAVGAGGGMAAYGAYSVWKLNRSIGRFHLTRPSQAADQPSSTMLPPSPTTPMTFLLLGFDSRQGRDAKFIDKTQPIDGQGGGGADSIILVRIDPVSKGTELLSIHRDLRVKIPGHSIGKINESLVDGSPDLATGGVPNASLSVQTIEEITGAHIDHVAMIDFKGFEDLTNAVGGVDICLKTPEKDRWTGENLQAGCQHVDGTQALAYSRSRHTMLFVDGKWQHDMRDDFSRMERQQNFLKALAQRMSDPSMITRLPDIADALKGSVYVDDKLDLMSSVSLARNLAGHLDQVQTAALPVYNFSSGGVDYVGLDTAKATSLLQAFNAGTMTTQQIVESVPSNGARATVVIPKTSTTATTVPVSGKHH